MAHEPDISFQHLLLPLEFSALSQPAEKTARSLAARLGAKVQLLHVIEPLGGLDEDPELERFYHRLEKRAAGQLQRLVGDFESANIPAGWEVAIGHRWQVIVQRASELNVDMIIMGSRGMEDSAPLVAIGSTSHRVAFHAPCPVLLVGRHALEHRAFDATPGT